MSEQPQDEIINVKWNAELEQFEAIGPSGKFMVASLDGEKWTGYQTKIEASND